MALFRIKFCEGGLGSSPHTYLKSLPYNIRLHIGFKFLSKNDIICLLKKKSLSQQNLIGKIFEIRNREVH